MANVDNNSRVVSFGVDSSGDVSRLKIDNATGYIIVKALSDGNPSLTDTTVDNNSRVVSFGVNSSGQPYSFKVSNTNNRLYTKSV